MAKRLEFDCTGAGDRIAVNDFLAHTIRTLRRQAFTLVSERNPDGSFEIRITGDGTAPGASQAAELKDKKRSRKAIASEVVSDSTAEQLPLPE